MCGNDQPEQSTHHGIADRLIKTDAQPAIDHLPLQACTGQGSRASRGVMMLANSTGWARDKHERRRRAGAGLQPKKQHTNPAAAMQGTKGAQKGSPGARPAHSFDAPSSRATVRHVPSRPRYFGVALLGCS